MRILLIGIRFFNYDQEIKLQLERLGHVVDLVWDMPKNYSLPMRFMSQKGIDKENYKYQMNIIKDIKDVHYDRLIVIVGRYLNPIFFQEFEKLNPSCKKILYLWDDLARVNNFDLVKCYYNHIFSFDNTECEKYNFSFLPLFYTDKYFPVGDEKKLDIFTVFSTHSDREMVIRKINEKHNFNSYFYIYVGRLRFLKLLLTFKQGRNNVYYHMMKLSAEKNRRLIGKTKSILDIQHPTQAGLTIRTFEALASGCKLITTNKNIEKYDFYNKNNILVINRDCPIIPVDFLNTPFIKYEDDLFKKYSISEWIKVLLEENSYNYLSI